MQITLNLTIDTARIHVPKGTVPNMCYHLPNSLYGDEWVRKLVATKLQNEEPVINVSPDTRQYINKAIEPMIYNAYLDAILCKTKILAQDCIDKQLVEEPSLAMNFDEIINHPKIAKLITMYQSL